MVNKIQHNHETGEWAENKGYFGVAMSRYYYATYQKIIHIMSTIPRGDGAVSTATHNEYISGFVEYARSKGVAESDVAYLTWIQVFRQLRNDADYKPTMPNPKAFAFMKLQYAKVHEIMDMLN